MFVSSECLFVSPEPGTEYAGGALKGHLGLFVFSFVLICVYLCLCLSPARDYDCVCLRLSGARQ